MEDRSKERRQPGRGKNAEETREDRLRAALRANLARRKAQARARSGKGAQETGGSNDTGGDES